MEELFLSGFHTGLIIDRVPPLQIGQELPDIKGGIGQGAGIEVNQGQPGRGDP